MDGMNLALGDSVSHDQRAPVHVYTGTEQGSSSATIQRPQHYPEFRPRGMAITPNSAAVVWPGTPLGTAARRLRRPWPQAAAVTVRVAAVAAARAFLARPSAGGRLWPVPGTEPARLNHYPHFYQTGMQTNKIWPILLVLQLRFLPGSHKHRQDTEHTA